MLPHITVDALVKFAPFTVSGNATLPVVVVAGAMLLIDGTGESISKLLALEVPPPGAGVCTVTEAVPAEATSVAVTWAVSCVALTNCVVRAVVPHRTVDALVKFAPFTVSVNAALPAVAVAGEMPLTEGTSAGP